MRGTIGSIPLISYYKPVSFWGSGGLSKHTYNRYKPYNTPSHPHYEPTYYMWVMPVIGYSPITKEKILDYSANQQAYKPQTLNCKPLNRNMALVEYGLFFF